jgi:anti-sigma regulatory factor (Ser/Thr protein kinase)
MNPTGGSELAWKRARKVRADSAAARGRSSAAVTEADSLLGKLLLNLDRMISPVGGRGAVFSLRLARTPGAVALARHDLRRWLDRHGVAPEDALDIVLACSEACANAVEHPSLPERPAFEVTATRGEGEVHLAVRDFGGWTEHAGDGGLRGRGLGMIRALMDSVEVTSDSAGTRIVMRRSLKQSST